MAVTGGHVFVAIYTGFCHSCALKADGSAWCWGYNEQGAVGKGAFSHAEPVPQQVAGGETGAPVLRRIHRTIADLAASDR